MGGIYGGSRLENRACKQSFVVLDTEARDEWLTGGKEKNTCEYSDPAAQLNRMCLGARISLAVQESDGNICRDDERRPVMAQRIAELDATAVWREDCSI